MADKKNRLELNLTARERSHDRLIFLVGLGYTLVIPPTVALVSQSSNAAWVALLSGGVVILLSRLNSIAEFSLGPLKARMREVVAEANATIDQLQDLAVSITSAFVTDLIWSSFMGRMPMRRRFQMHDDLIAQLKSLGATEEKLSDVDREWNKGIHVIYHRIITNQIATAANLKGPQYNALTGEFRKLLDFPTLTVSPPEAFEELAHQHNVMNPLAAKWIDDYRHFRQTGEIRRTDEFMKE